MLIRQLRCEPKKDQTLVKKPVGDNYCRHSSLQTKKWEDMSPLPTPPRLMSLDSNPTCSLFDWVRITISMNLMACVRILNKIHPEFSSWLIVRHIQNWKTIVILTHRYLIVFYPWSGSLTCTGSKKISQKNRLKYMNVQGASVNRNLEFSGAFHTQSKDTIASSKKKRSGFRRTLFFVKFDEKLSK